MKKIISLILAATLIISLLTGCKKQKTDDTAFYTSNQDQDTLTVLLPYNKMLPAIEAMKKEFPDIKFEIETYIGDNASAYLGERIVHGDAGDIIYYTVFTPLEEHTSQFYDLSGEKFVSELNSDILDMINVNGHIYQIPGPLETRCISYNKTMFEEYGWKVPENFDELITVVKQIRKEAPGITPIASAGQNAYYFSLASAIAQAGFLSTSDGYKWEQAYFKGEASLGEGFKEGLIGTERLIEAEAFDAEKYAGKWSVERSMVNREAAMNIQWSGMTPLFNQIEERGTTDEFALLPFFGLNNVDKVIVFNSTGNWSINKKLEEKGNEKKLENALRVMEWLTKKEGQELLSTNNGQIAVTGEEFEIDSRIEELIEFTRYGYKAPMIYTGYEHVLIETGNIIAEAAMSGDTEGMSEAFVQTGDSLNKQYIENKDTTFFRAYLNEDLNYEQTAQLMANILQDTGMGDFTLITHTGIKNGISNRYGAAGSIYAGGIIQHDVLTINANRNLFVATIEMTGKEVRTLLEQGKGLYEGESDDITNGNETADYSEEAKQEYFPYYWSGLDVIMKDDKVTSMKLDGVELEDENTYTVVFMQNDYPREYKDTVTVSNSLVQDVLISYFMKNEEIYAPEVLRK